MYKLLSFYNKNKKKIWLWVLIIVSVIILYRIVNNFIVANANKEKTNNNVNTNITTNINKNNYSVMTDTTIPTTVSSKIENTVEKFIEYCNEGDLEKAYNLISKECKEELFNTLDSFKKYHEQIFNTKKDYEMQAWISSNGKYTYKMKFIEDTLSTGIVSDFYKEDYYTLILENGEYKININNFVEKKSINKSINKDGFIINVKNKTTYMDYEIYEIEVTNNTSNTVILDTKETTSGIYIGNNKIGYAAAIHEIADNELIFNMGNKRTIEFKFIKSYDVEQIVNYITFADTRIDGKIEKIKIDL